MRSASVCFTLNTTTIFLLCFVHHALSQLVGCNGTDVDCPKQNTKVEGGVCRYDGKQDGIGIMSFESNITSDGLLTWTMTEGDQTPKNNPFSYRGFYLGSPSSLDFQNVTDFGACAMVLGGNITSNLQLPFGFNDYSNFGCGTVMGHRCAQDIAAQVRNQLLDLLNDTSYDSAMPPCAEVGRRLEGTPYPESCAQAFRTQQFGYQDATSTLRSELRAHLLLCQH